MSVAHPAAGGRRARAYAPEPTPINWTMVGVVAGLLGNLAAGVWFASGLTTRVGHLEQEVPPGVIQRLDERTVQIQAALQRLEARP